MHAARLMRSSNLATCQRLAGCAGMLARNANQPLGVLTAAVTRLLVRCPAVSCSDLLARTHSRVSTPVKRKNRDLGGGGGYGSGQINAYPPPAAGANPAAGAVMMSLAEELLTKKGLSLKDLQVRVAADWGEWLVRELAVECALVLVCGPDAASHCMAPAEAAPSSAV